MEVCPVCQGRKSVMDPNISEGMLGTFSCAEYDSLPRVPCPRCGDEDQDQD